MRLKIIVILLPIFISIIFITGCTEDKNNASDLDKIVGTWEYTGEDFVSVISFYENLSLYSNSTIISNQEVHEDWGEFWFSENKLCMYTHMGASWGEETYCYNYIFTNDNKKLTLTTPGLPDSILIKID